MGTKDAKHKKSYTVSCSSEFRKKITALADKMGVNIADLTRSAVIMLSKEQIDAFPDPGDAPKGDRDVIISKNNEEKPARAWQRKPRVQVRLGDNYDAVLIRKALGLMLAIHGNDIDVALKTPEDKLAEKKQQQEIMEIQKQVLEIKKHRDEKLKEKKEISRNKDDEGKIHEIQHKLEDSCLELDRLHAIVNILTFKQIKGGIKSKAQAMHVMSLTPDVQHSFEEVKNRYRLLATIHHPDSKYGSTEKMTLLNDAFTYIRKHQV